MNYYKKSCRTTHQKHCFVTPSFWSSAKRLKFLCDLSDRIELCNANQETTSSNFNIFAIEQGAFEVFGTSWVKHVDQGLIIASLNRRTYDPASVRDFLRMIRNKHHHWDELSQELKDRVGMNTDGFSRYVSKKFPYLITHCYHFCIANMSADDQFAADYKLPISRSRIINHQSSSIVDITEPLLSLEPISDDGEKEIAVADGAKGDSFVSNHFSDDKSQMPSAPQDSSPSKRVNDGTEEPLSTSIESLSGIVVWSGSNAARQFNCRGWIRSEDEWIQRVDAKVRKRDANVTRCADDPKFRTRLCNEWDTSGGTFCSMKKKNKCIFAHGPIELRVKEGKRKRWGTLVNKQGECANPKASGGEDTYTPAKNIEDLRKEKGEWNAGKSSKKQHKSGSGKNTPNAKGNDQKKRPTSK